MRSDRYIEKEEIKEKDIEEKQPKKKSFKKYLFILLFILILLFLYSRFIEPNIITIKEYKIENELLKENFNGFKIVHISDIHYGTNINKEKLNKIVEKINNLKPDIVVFTGDLFDKDINLNDDNYKDITDALTKINPRLYKYAITGNEDYDNNYYTILDNSNFILLDNKVKLIFDNGLTPIALFGFPSNNADYSILDNEEYKDYFKISLIHEPDNVDHVLNTNLILAGHTLGGTINLGSPLFKKEGALKYNKNFYNIDNSLLYISNGLGTNKYNIRFNNNPKINLYRLYKKDSN